MFRQVYILCLSVFLLQGALLVPLVGLAGVAWFRQMARLGAIGKALGRDRARQERTLASLLGALPKLEPLNCAACGAAVTLDATACVCIACGARSAPPADYAATLSLRRRLTRLSRVAVRHWYLARLLVSAPLRLVFRLMIFGEPLLFLVVLIGAVEYGDTRFDRAFAAMGEGWSFALMLLSFCGFILWMIVFLMLASLSRELRRKLPLFPAFVARGDAAVEFANCRSCGGGLSFGARAFAALCGYCGTETIRAEQGRREWAEAARERVPARASGRMSIPISARCPSTVAARR